MSTELSLKPGMIRPGTKLVGLAAKKQAALEAQRAADEAKGITKREPIILINPNDAPERIGIVFDDSYSMDADDAIQDSIAGCEEFMRSCKPNQTAVAIYPMNGPVFNLCSDLPALALLVKGIKTNGCTPLCETLNKALTANLTRAIVFSDGTPDYGLGSDYYIKAVATSKDKSIPVDTVFIGPESNVSAVTFMKRLAEDTGGIYLHFDPAKSNFRTAFKYLAPGFRAMLADKSFVEKLENGGV